MTEFPHFAGIPVFTVTVEGSRADAGIPVAVNGHTIKVKRNTPTRMPEPFLTSLLTGGYPVISQVRDEAESTDEIATGDLGEGDLGAGAGGTGEDGSSPSGATTIEANQAENNSTTTYDDVAGNSGAPAFDAEAVINGTVAEVAERLAGLTPEQLAAVKAAEEDREQSRKGVLEAIAKLTAEPPAA